MSSTPTCRIACVVCAALLLLPACYTTRVVSGGANLLAQRRPIDKVLAGDDLTPEERRRLELARALREFAVAELALPDSGSYTSYVGLDREYVTWNVVAAPELSVDPLTWCFPVVGCVAYRGYFKEGRARKFAAKLERQGHDVRVGGVDAYSTLGKFKDPVLSTFLDRSDPDLAGLLFHEMAHQVIYVKGDTTFNESFATVVELAGITRWLTAEGREDEYADVEREQELERRFTELLLEYRERLATLYESDATDDEKRAGKARVFDELRADYDDRKEDWGDSRYDGWIHRPLDNANLVGVASYHGDVAALSALLESCDGSFATFYERIRELGELDAEERAERLTSLSPAG